MYFNDRRQQKRSWNFLTCDAWMWSEWFVSFLYPTLLWHDTSRSGRERLSAPYPRWLKYFTREAHWPPVSQSAAWATRCWDAKAPLWEPSENRRDCAKSSIAREDLNKMSRVVELFPRIFRRAMETWEWTWNSQKYVHNKWLLTNNNGSAKLQLVTLMKFPQGTTERLCI